MSIEDFWLDGTIYSIQFKAAHLDYIITKQIILPGEIDPHLLESIIYQKFNNISDIVDICELGDCLIDKNYQLT